jgi:tetratricopeptide (TPR) repeat protein
MLNTDLNSASSTSRVYDFRSVSSELWQKIALDITTNHCNHSSWERVNYRAVKNWLTKYIPSSNASNLEEVRGFLESSYHLINVKDWETAEEILGLHLSTPTQESLHSQLGTWGYYREQVKLYTQLASKSELASMWLSYLGNAYHCLGNYHAAIDCQQKSLSFIRRLQALVKNNQELLINSNLESISIANNLIDINSIKQIERMGLEGLGIAYQSLSKYNEAIDCYHQSLVISGEIEDYRGVVQSQGNLGGAYHALGDYRSAIDYCQKSLILAQQIQYRKGEFSALASLGNCHQALSDYELAIKYYQQALTIAREIQYRQGEFTILGNMGVVYQVLAAYDEAIDFHQQHLMVAREIGDCQGEGIALGNLGNVAISLANYDFADQCFRQRLIIAMRTGDKVGEQAALLNIGNVFLNQGKCERAIEYYQQSLRISTAIGDFIGESMNLGNLGSAYYALSDYQVAIDFYLKRLEIARMLRDRLGEAQTLKNLGTAYYSIGDYNSAMNYQQMGLTISRELKDLAGEGIALCNIGIMLLNHSEAYVAALEYLQSSLSICTKIGDQHTIAFILKGFAEIFYKQNQYDHAIEHCDHALFIATKLGIPLAEECQKLKEEILAR